MISECGAVPMDAATRADLIDLMALALVARCFTRRGEEEMIELLHNPKIKPEHLARKAIVYLRQSTDKQVRQNKESQLLQYAMAERVRALGWQEVEIINNDLGSSAGLAAARREGFERVLSSVALGEVSNDLAGRRSARETSECDVSRRRVPRLHSRSSCRLY